MPVLSQRSFTVDPNSYLQITIAEIHKETDDEELNLDDILCYYGEWGVIAVHARLTEDKRLRPEDLVLNETN